MQILLITPAAPGSKAGNRATAERWSGLLEREGHRVSIVTEYPDKNAQGPCDLLIALHAWRSADALQQFRQDQPGTPVILALTGTDIYDHQYRFPEITYGSMAVADCLIGLHHGVARDIPEHYVSKLVTVLQSADRPAEHVVASPDDFRVCVIGHLRDEKDPIRAALAAQLLPVDSKVRVVNAGKSNTQEWEDRAREEQASNPRFEWLGEVDKAQVQALMRSSRLMVISSVMEGGANVVSEACRAGLPILASDISGNIGLLGDDYPGYFCTADEQDLARLLARAEASPAFVEELRQRVSELAAGFTPEAEQAALAAAITMALAQRTGFTRSE